MAKANQNPAAETKAQDKDKAEAESQQPESGTKPEGNAKPDGDTDGADRRGDSDGERALRRAPESFGWKVTLNDLPPYFVSIREAPDPAQAIAKYNAHFGIRSTRWTHGCVPVHDEAEMKRALRDQEYRRKERVAEGGGRVAKKLKG